MSELSQSDPGDEHDWDRRTFENLGRGMEQQRIFLKERKAMERRLIRQVLDTIPDEQNVQSYEDSKGKKGFRNPVRPAVGDGLERLVDVLSIDSAVELGTALGRSGLHMALGGLKELDTVEYDIEAAAEAQRNFNNAGLNFRVHNMDSGEFTKGWDKRPIPMVFIDHAKERYLEDLQALEPYLTEDALVLMDNTFNRASECKEAVDYVSANYLSFMFTEPPTGKDATTTGLLVASKDRRVIDTAYKVLMDVRSENFSQL